VDFRFKSVKTSSFFEEEKKRKKVKKKDCMLFFLRPFSVKRTALFEDFLLLRIVHKKKV